MSQVDCRRFILRFGYGNTRSPRPIPKERPKQTRVTSCTTSFGLNNLVNI